MTAANGQPPVRGRVDALGNLVAADAPLAALNARAGGMAGGPLVIPQLAAVARLARRADAPISRAVLAADGDRDLDLWVRAGRAGDAVELAIVGWTPRPPAAPKGRDEPDRELDFLRATADWLWEVDEGLRITALSTAAGPALGEGDSGAAAGDGFLGRSLTAVFRLLEDDDGDLPILVALAEQRRFDDQQVALRTEDATRFRLAAVPLIDQRGRFAGFRGVAVAHGPRPGGEEAAAPSAAFGRQLDRALRVPLDRIVADAEAIRAEGEGPLMPEYAGYAADIATAGRHLLALVDDLVDLQAIERDDVRPARDPIDLADLARRAAALVGVRAADRRIRIERPDEGIAMPATGDVHRVLQILVNLIGNAVRYSPEDTTVRIVVAHEGSRAAVSVVDEGRGIALDDQERIFDKFERLGAAEAGGSGLGLYIARQLARAMDGDIEVESDPGEGACFTLTLPGR